MSKRRFLEKMSAAVGEDVKSDLKGKYGPKPPPEAKPDLEVVVDAAPKDPLADSDDALLEEILNMILEAKAKKDGAKPEAPTGDAPPMPLGV